MKGGTAEADGRLMQGDQILAVNKEDMRNATQEYAAAVLKVGQACGHKSRSSLWLPKVDQTVRYNSLRIKEVKFNTMYH